MIFRFNVRKHIFKSWEYVRKIIYQLITKLFTNKPMCISLTSYCDSVRRVPSLLFLPKPIILLFKRKEITR